MGPNGTLQNPSIHILTLVFSVIRQVCLETASLVVLKRVQSNMMREIFICKFLFFRIFLCHLMSSNLNKSNETNVYLKRIYKFSICFFFHWETKTHAKPKVKHQSFTLLSYLCIFCSVFEFSFNYTMLFLLLI